MIVLYNFIAIVIGQAIVLFRLTGVFWPIQRQHRNGLDYFGVGAIIATITTDQLSEDIMTQRMYEAIILDHLSKYTQMIFLAGPRQVGKTTIAKHCGEKFDYKKYLNWDITSHREQILSGEEHITQDMPLSTPATFGKKPLIIFDELHKYKKWKNFLKGFVDSYREDLHILVTGSAQFNVVRRGGDSLMGRYFLYRVHPFSVAEMLQTSLPTQLYSSPKKIADDQWNTLFEFGGFPEPLLKQEKIFYTRWQNSHQEQLFRGDIRDLAHIQELAQLEILAVLLQRQAGQLVNFSELAKKIRVADTSIRRWIKILESFFYCFSIQPWTKNVARSLLKNPKIYLWDWSIIEDRGQKIENFVACHLLKAVHGWSDLGFGKYKLYFVRDKEGHEVDFLITENEKPWALIEVKSSMKEPLSKNLAFFQSQLGAKHVFQLVFDMPFQDIDCFQLKNSKIVSLKTFLSQLI